jgi:hypothetical protein
VVRGAGQVAYTSVLSCGHAVHYAQGVRATTGELVLCLRCDQPATTTAVVSTTSLSRSSKQGG